jgi:hypothetical protein
MLELRGSNLVFNFPQVHPCARVQISFERTLRIPDDDKTYPLPPTLGSFPVRHVEDFGARLPDKWKSRGGVMLPMYQSEAMWIYFHGEVDRERGVTYPFAIKVAAGKQSAVTGKPWSKKLRQDDYCVVPQQRWLDGYVVGEGLIRQFVAMPLGGGFTVEEQLTGKAEFGGVQVEAIPMRRAEYERRFPKRPPRERSCLRGMSLGSLGSHKVSLHAGEPSDWSVQGMSLNCSLSADRGDRGEGAVADSLLVESMGLGAGGRMQQQVFDDPYGLSDWDASAGTRCFVHLANSMTWKTITGEQPPTVPLTAEDYTRHGMPWFSYYAEDPALKGTKALQGVKTVKQIGHAKAVPALPENMSVHPTHVHAIKSSGKQVKDGVWK